MKFATKCLVWVLFTGVAQGFMSPYCFRSVVMSPSSSCRLGATSPGADIEQPPADEEIPVAVAKANTDASDAASPLAPNARGKVNEIDFCIAPADVSLSRSYAASAAIEPTDSASPRLLSLTRALNNASNRAVRRILLARSWPSAEALNMSLRQVLAADKQRKEAKTAADAVEGGVETSTAKCPVPRPILNILVGQKRGSQPMPRGRTDEEYVADQIKSFREKYGAVPGFPLAEAYLECILSLATSGVESPRVSEVMASGVYDESYRRVLAVLKSVGATFENVPDTDPPRSRIASKLVDQDICLSMLDKITMKQEKLKKPTEEVEHKNKPTIKPEVETLTSPVAATAETETDKEAPAEEKKGSKSRRKLKFWKKDEDASKDNGEKAKDETKMEESEEGSEAETKEEENEITQDDLGAVLLSAEEPTMTRQLNVLSNIVQRALLFGGDQELLVLSETLSADKPAFIQRWYPGTDFAVDDSMLKEETRPGVQFLNSLVQLLRECYTNGVVTTSDSPVPLIPSYSNAYERLIASLVELGSGYIRLVSSSPKMPVPRTAQEELGRFAVWESSFRKETPDVSSYPEDLEGSWEVKDEIGGEEIGISTVVFKAQGQVEVAPPMHGLRWRLDPGPTHLDTCTFQVLGDDGTILQYRGFIDRGARLEARFSKRPIRIRGSVMFQMRDGESVVMGEGYWKDMLPINYRTGTTKFVMTKAIQEQNK